MDIKRYDRIKRSLESKISEFNDVVEERWKKLIGPGCGYFISWSMEKDMVSVSYRSPSGNIDSDEIPMRFFEIESDDEAVKQFQVFNKQKQVETNLKMIAEKRESRWEEYKKLKKEFEPNG